MSTRAITTAPASSDLIVRQAAAPAAAGVGVLVGAADELVKIVLAPLGGIS